MSEEQLKAFLETVKADAGLQEKLKAATDAEGVMAIAKAAGFAISADNLKRTQAELSDEELEGVAGGLDYEEARWQGARLRDLLVAQTPANRLGLEAQRVI